MRVLMCLSMVALGVIGCVSANRGETKGLVVDDQTVHDVPVRGWQVEVETSGSETPVEGELLAVDASCIYLLRYPPYRVWSAPRIDVAQVHLDLYQDRAPLFAVWAFLGAVSTFSHGYLALYTAPVWVVGGVVAVATGMRRPKLTLDQDRFNLLFQYARFPAGPPPGVLHQAAADQGSAACEASSPFR